jgi:hypothetical protein
MRLDPLAAIMRNTFGPRFRRFTFQPTRQGFAMSFVLIGLCNCHQSNNAGFGAYMRYLKLLFRLPLMLIDVISC